MNKVKGSKVFKAAVWYTISSFISKGILYLCTPLYTRLLTTAEYGQYSNFLSWQSILTALITFDLSSSINTAYLDYKEGSSFDAFISTIALFSMLIPAAICFLSLFFFDSLRTLLDMNHTQVIILISFLCFANTLGIFQTEQNVRMKYKVSSFLTLLSSCGGVAVTLALVFLFPNKLNAILVGNVILAEGISMVLLIKMLIKNNHCQWKYLKYALTIAIPLVPHILASTILGSSDKIMITKICGSNETAFYSLIYTISMLVTMFASSINRAWVPWFFGRLKDQDYFSIKRAVRLMLPLGSMASVMLCLLGPEIVQVVGGEKYREAIYLMPPLVLHSVVNYFSTLYINIEFFQKKTFGISVATVITSLVNVGLNYVCIRNFGYRAAAYTTLFSSMLSLAFHVIKIRRQNMWKVFDNQGNFKVLAATFALCLWTLFLYDYPIIRGGCIVIAGLALISIVFIRRNMIAELLGKGK